jgi:FlaA1/EpsC-like NDP-sugar epimerase
MSTAQRFAWLDGLSTVAMCAAALALVPAHSATPWGVAGRIAIVTVVGIVAFYYNDLYNFEAPHDFAQLFTRLCRALGISALVLAGAYLMFPEMIVGGNVAAYALLLTLLAVPSLRVIIYALAKRPPFSERVLILGGGRFAGELARQVETRSDLALRVVGCLTPTMETEAASRLGDYGDVGEVARRLRPDRIVVAVPDRRGNLPVSDLWPVAFAAWRSRRVRVSASASPADWRWSRSRPARSPSAMASASAACSARSSG